MAYAETELAKVHQSRDLEDTEMDIAKWEGLLEGLRVLQHRREASEWTKTVPATKHW
jgi:hypothetical protein